VHNAVANAQPEPCQTARTWKVDS